ncbi:GNAT family N-acetyltransferase [Actinocorallia sp. API 0066]|uniref:GNAT family N-acetyltransferase n=1 Tax=Actinocorallia sp. API 0066 TaxID=2896846 RepID=UPI001E4D55FB|nr:GNAT family N-acetyltransferase [Actinocorallia sp. API 0066]MCD0448732.1 GNAT family N-acetyltransferase [Actinocorallia sp. API 0066]
MTASGEPREITVTEWAMEMRDPAALRPAPLPSGEMTFTLARVASPDVNRALYAAVGARVCWTDRFGWTHTDWAKWVDRPELATWLALAEGTVAGYFELEAQPDGDTEVHLVGLVPAFVGRGFGGYLVEQCVRRAWQRGRLWGDGLGPTRRVWLRTSTLDHPNAKANYLRRGFAVAWEETGVKAVPDPRMAPWPLPDDPRRAPLGAEHEEETPR